MIEMFSGQQIGNILKDKLMHPSNAFALEHNVHQAFDQLLWSIEAIQQGNDIVTYFHQFFQSKN
jgi:hypothetical protein